MHGRQEGRRDSYAKKMVKSPKLRNRISHSTHLDELEKRES